MKQRKLRLKVFKFSELDSGTLWKSFSQLVILDINAPPLIFIVAILVTESTLHVFYHITSSVWCFKWGFIVSLQMS